MATLPRDPLDELIADLERTLPPQAASAADSDREFVGMQMLVAAVLSGSDEQRARAEQDPRVQAFLEASRRMVSRRSLSLPSSRSPSGRRK